MIAQDPSGQTGLLSTLYMLNKLSIIWKFLLDFPLLRFSPILLSSPSGVGGNTWLEIFTDFTSGSISISFLGKHSPFLTQQAF